jgi:hypothetical protein
MMKERAASDKLDTSETMSPGKEASAHTDSPLITVVVTPPACCCWREKAMGKSLGSRGYAKSQRAPSSGEVNCINRKLRLAKSRSRNNAAVESVMVSSIIRNRLISLRVTKFFLNESHIGSPSSLYGFSSLAKAPAALEEEDEEDEEEEEEDDEEEDEDDDEEKEEEDDAEAAAEAEAANKAGVSGYGISKI